MVSRHIRSIEEAAREEALAETELKADRAASEHARILGVANKEIERLRRRVRELEGEHSNGKNGEHSNGKIDAPAKKTAASRK